MSDNRPTWLRVSQPFLSGGLAGALATSALHPVDLVKVRIQLAGVSTSHSPFVVGAEVIQSEGWTGLYRGVDAGIARQLTYTTTRLGVFRLVSNAMQKEGEKLPFWKKGLAGIAAGGVGALVGTPAEVALVRMQADTLLPPAERREYSSIFNALKRIANEEGAAGLWKGSLPTISRAMCMNLGMLATFDHAQEHFTEAFGKPGWAATLVAAGFSGFTAAVFSLPFDFVKTRMQRMKVDPLTGELPYKSSLDCVQKVIKAEGPLALYSGFPTYYSRIAPHAMIILVIVDRLNVLTKIMYERRD